MDRRLLHKVNNQKIGKNKQIAARTRANKRAADQDALREIEPVEEVVKVSRIERLKQWRLEKEEKKKKDEELKKKPFVTVVKRGVFLDKTNYTELNKKRRKKAETNKPKVDQKLPQAIQAQSAFATAANNFYDIGTSTINHTEVIRADNHIENVELPAIPENSSELNNTFEMQHSIENNETSAMADMLTIPNVNSELNTTFEMQSSTDNNEMSEVNNQSIKSVAESANVLTVPDNSSVLNTTFEMENSVENNGSSENEIAASSILMSSDQLKNTPKSQKQTTDTPKSLMSTSLNYVSPFVTIARGKGSAQKEVKVRESFYKLELSRSDQGSPVARQNQAAAQYFRFQVNKETTNLMQTVEYWTKYKSENAQLDSVYLDQIDVAIGQTRLLIDKKFKQFLKLCDECEKETGEKPVLPKDLEGFWSMVYMQVENCNQRFGKLVTLKENDWIEVDLLMPAKVVKQTKNKRAAKKGTSASIGIQKLIEEARLKMKESRITATATSSSNSDDSHGYSMKLRQTPARLSFSSTKTPRSIIKAKTPGLSRNTKSVAFSLDEPPKTSPSSKAAATPKPRVIKRRASTSGIPSENTSSTTANNSSFLTPNNRKVSIRTTSSVRRSHRELFTVAEK